MEGNESCDSTLGSWIIVLDALLDRQSLEKLANYFSVSMMVLYNIL